MKRWINRPEDSNWGEFGDDDQIGRMNLLTPQRRLGGFAEVKEGIAFTLSLPLDYPGGRMGPFRHPPKLSASEGDGQRMFNHTMPNSLESTCDDQVVLHTQYSTQWDSLAHRGRRFDADGDGVPELVYYNGFRAGQHVRGPAENGATCAAALGIENLAMAGVQGRGVMINLKAAFGLEARAIGYDDLMRAIDHQKVDVRTGDFVLLYTGLDRVLLDMQRQPDPAIVMGTGAALDGFDRRLRQWVVDSGLVALCSDNIAIETIAGMRSPEPLDIRLPLHDLCLFRHGIHLGEIWYLEALAKWLAAHERTAFLLTAPPLRLPGSVGSPVTPVATV